MAFFTGRLIDIRGRRNCLIVGAAMYGFAALIPVLWPDPAPVLMARLINGVGKSIVLITTVAIISDVVPKRRMNEGMGYYNLGATISMAFGPILGLSLVENGSFNLMFTVTAMFCLIASALGFGLNREKKAGRAGPEAMGKTGSAGPEPATQTNDGRTGPEPAVQTNDGRVEYKGVWKLIEKKAILYSINCAVFAAGHTCVLFFLTIYAQEQLRLNSSQIGLFFTMTAIAMFLVRLFFSRLGDIYGVLSLIVPGHISAILTLVILAFFSDGRYILFLVAGALYGIAFGSVASAINAAAVVDSPAGRSSASNATYYFFLDFGVLFSSAIFGALVDAAVTPEAGYMQMYLISIGITGFSLIMSFLLFNEKARARRRAR